jgi:virulence-associated protein VagC
MDMQDTSRYSFEGKAIIHVRAKDGTRVYYDEDRQIHREPTQGPAIEASDGTGPCYIYGIQTGECYEAIRVPVVRATKAEIDSVLSNDSVTDRYSDDFENQTQTHAHRPSRMQLLSELAQGGSFDAEFANGMARNKGKAVTVTRKGKKVILAPMIKASHTVSLADVASKPLEPWKLESRGTSENPVKDAPMTADKTGLERVAKMLREKFSPLRLERRNSTHSGGPMPMSGLPA